MYIKYRQLAKQIDNLPLLFYAVISALDFYIYLINSTIIIWKLQWSKYKVTKRSVTLSKSLTIVEAILSNCRYQFGDCQFILQYCRKYFYWRIILQLFLAELCHCRKFVNIVDERWSLSKCFSLWRNQLAHYSKLIAKRCRQTFRYSWSSFESKRRFRRQKWKER